MVEREKKKREMVRFKERILYSYMKRAETAASEERYNKTEKIKP